MRCDCDDYAKGIKQIDGWQSFAMTHFDANFQGPTMRFCPWCGKKLSEPVPEPIAVLPLKELLQMDPAQ